MDVEFDLLYLNLSLHHLEREELEYELLIRGLPFTTTETRAALMRRLKDHFKSDSNAKIDIAQCDFVVDTEIKKIDSKIKEIQEFLAHRNKFEGIRESLKTRLAHYFKRTKRLTEITEKDEDLADIDDLIACIRGTFNNNFSMYAPLGQRDVIEKLNQSISQLVIGNKSASGTDQNRNRTSTPSEEDEDLTEGASNARTRRLKSIIHKQEQQNLPDLGANIMPLLFQQWMMKDPQMQNWVQQMVREQASEYFGKTIRTNSRTVQQETARVTKVQSKASRRSKNVVQHSSSESRKSSSTEAGWSSDEPRNSSRGSKNVHKSGKRRPVSDWKLKYDGSDNGLALMKFLREVEFYAKSEKMSNKELFQSAIHLFNGPAKTWFMTGFDNEDFTSWEELKEELKKEFLSPDHDHSTEIRAISRKQGQRESFHDYFLELQKIFNALTKPMTERRKFEIVFRNMRADYKGHAVSSEIDNLADLKKFGRRLDATYWFKYQNTSNDSSNTRGKTSQVNEITAGAKQKPKIKGDVGKQKSRTFHNSSLQPRGSDDERHEEKHPRKQTDSGARPKEQTDSPISSQYNHPPPKYCLNCRSKGHHTRDCDRPRQKSCQKCAYPNVETASCPNCPKNDSKTVAEGRQLDQN